MTDARSFFRESPFAEKYLDIGKYFLADFVLFEIHFRNGVRKSSEIILAEDAALMVKVEKKLHVNPGVNPFNKGKCAVARSMMTGRPVFEGPFLWDAPDAPRFDESGAYVLGWADFKPRFGHKIDTGEAQVFRAGPYDPAAVKFSDLRRVEISMANGSCLARWVHKNDVIKFLEAQEYLAFVPELIAESDGSVKRVKEVAAGRERHVSFVWSQPPVFSGPYWWTSPDFTNYSPKGVSIVASGPANVIYDDGADVC